MTNQVSIHIVVNTMLTFKIIVTVLSNYIGLSIFYYCFLQLHIKKQRIIYMCVGRYIATYTYTTVQEIAHLNFQNTMYTCILRLCSGIQIYLRFYAGEAKLLNVCNCLGWKLDSVCIGNMCSFMTITNILLNYMRKK